MQADKQPKVALKLNSNNYSTACFVVSRVYNVLSFTENLIRSPAVTFHLLPISTFTPSEIKSQTCFQTTNKEKN